MQDRFIRKRYVPYIIVLFNSIPGKNANCVLLRINTSIKKGMSERNSSEQKYDTDFLNG